MDDFQELEQAIVNVYTKYLSKVPAEAWGREFDDEITPVANGVKSLLRKGGVSDEALNDMDEFLFGTELLLDEDGELFSLEDIQTNYLSMINEIIEDFN